RNNSGDLGKALMEGLSNAMLNAASAAWDKVANMAANFLLNAVMGQPSAGLLNKGIGFTGANTTLGALLGASAANDNVAGGFSGLSVGSVTRAPLGPIAGGDIASYIANAASQRGIDPSIALRVAKSEGGLNSWNMRAGYVKNGYQEPSYGPFQLLKGGPGTGFPAGLGNDFMRRTGLDPALASNGPAGVDFALDHAAKNGWGAWYGAAKVGVGRWDGIGSGAGMGDAAEAVAKLAESAGAATKGLDVLGGGLGQVGQALSTSFFPAAPAAGGGGGGGLFGWLGGLFGGGGNPSLAKYLPLTGLFADGTNYAPGGMALVGERGPELINLPQGSQVFDTNRSARMMGGNDNRGGQRPQLNVYVQGGSGDDHVRELARQGAQEAIFQYQENQVRGGALETQQKATARKG
ncbi:MAG TPA: phage tail tape measure protein, partial [Pseudorhizobium sp.]|nr:phage tail tape measure protein [Pseudorhizobium sp.]